MANDILRVGIIQTSLDYSNAWDQSAAWPGSVQISLLEEARAKKEIRHHLASLRGFEHPADIVMLPELSVPIGYENKLIKAAEKLESIVIAGLDYKVESFNPRKVSNEAIVIVPSKINGKRIAASTSVRRVGKTYAAPQEAAALEKGSIEFVPNPTVWLFKSGELGDFGVAVCYDFMDLDRISMYRTKIQTLFILAYNRDTTSFHHMAESISRTVFCNVVVCNCGYYGDSLAVSPFRESYERTVYRHSGLKLPNAQIVELPLESLRLQQSGSTKSGRFKNLPPGYKDFWKLVEKDEVL
ncbi:hypothetical protein ACOXXX_03090 [Thalassococcus sp. BH17M4-6]|uniref:hypothetical protein n=1 Tax=Thalassococcus sp. BH17M4-6 TaxID=3413148 RepID=UPI003BE707D4